MRSAQDLKVQQKRELKRLMDWCGSKARLAETLGVTRQTVYYWEKRGRISATMATEIERKTGGMFTRKQLRPDVITWGQDV